MSFDPLSPFQRSERMSRIKDRDTKPEIFVRRLIFNAGYRYRINVKKLPGSPDVVFKSKKKIIFIHGCFWHQHGCNNYRMPHSKLDYWLPKLKRNVERDKDNIARLKEEGWSILVIWECEIINSIQISEKIISFLESS